MKIFILVMQVFLMSALTAEVKKYDGYKLVWSDEFNTDGPVSDEWNFEEGFLRNEEMQWYQKENAYFYRVFL